MTRCDSPGVARGGYSPGGARGVFVAMHPRVLARGALQVSDPDQICREKSKGSIVTTD